jgi:hypothetical protein
MLVNLYGVRTGTLHYRKILWCAAGSMRGNHSFQLSAAITECGVLRGASAKTPNQGQNTPLTRSEGPNG